MYVYSIMYSYVQCLYYVNVYVKCLLLNSMYLLCICMFIVQRLCTVLYVFSMYTWMQVVCSCTCSVCVRECLCMCLVCIGEGMCSVANVFTTRSLGTLSSWSLGSWWRWGRRCTGSGGASRYWWRWWCSSSSCSGDGSQSWWRCSRFSGSWSESFLAAWSLSPVYTRINISCWDKTVGRIHTQKETLCWTFSWLFFTSACTLIEDHYSLLFFWNLTHCIWWVSP